MSVRDRLDRLEYDDIVALCQYIKKEDVTGVPGRSGLLRLARMLGMRSVDGLGKDDLTEAIGDYIEQSTRRASRTEGLVDSVLLKRLHDGARLKKLPEDPERYTRRELIQALIPLTHRSILPMDIQHDPAGVWNAVLKIVSGQGRAALELRERLMLHFAVLLELQEGTPKPGEGPARAHLARACRELVDRQSPDPQAVAAIKDVLTPSLDGALDQAGRLCGRPKGEDEEQLDAVRAELNLLIQRGLADIQELPRESTQVIERATSSFTQDILRVVLRSTLLRQTAYLRDVGLERWDRFQTLAGVQFFFDTDFQLVNGHVYYSGTDWALTSINQSGLWEYEPSLHQGGVRSILSVIVGDWQAVSPRIRKSAKECTKDELAQEVWHQVCDALANDRERLAVSQVFPEPVLYSLDRFVDLPKERRSGHRAPASGSEWNLFAGRGQRGSAGMESRPYLVPMVDDWVRRPGGYPWNPNGRSAAFKREDGVAQAERRVWMAEHGGYEVYADSLVFAGTWTKTFTRMTTMEAACESARHAVNAILDHWIYSASPPLPNGARAHAGRPQADADADADDATDIDRSNQRRADGRPAGYVGLHWRLPSDYVDQRGLHPISQPTPAGDYCQIYDMEQSEPVDLRPLRDLDALSNGTGSLGGPASQLAHISSSGEVAGGVLDTIAWGSTSYPLRLADWVDQLNDMRRYFDLVAARLDPVNAIPGDVDNSREGLTGAPPGWLEVLDD